MSYVINSAKQLLSIVLLAILTVSFIPTNAFAIDGGGSVGGNGGDGSETARGLDLRWWGFSLGGWDTEDIPDSSEYLSGELLPAPKDKLNANKVNEQKWFGSTAYDESIYGDDCIWATALATKSNCFAYENKKGYMSFADNYTVYNGKSSEVGDFRVDFFKKVEPHNEKSYIIGYYPCNFSGDSWSGNGPYNRKSYAIYMGERQVDANGVVVDGGKFTQNYQLNEGWKFSGNKICIKNDQVNDGRNLKVMREIHYNAHQFTVTRTYYDIQKTIISTQNTGSDFNNSSLETSESGRKWLYNNPIEYGEYGDTTPPTNSGTKKNGVTQDYTNTVKITTEDIKKTVTVKFNPGMTPEDLLGIPEADRDLPENRQKLFDKAIEMIEKKHSDPTYENITDDADNIIEEYTCETSSKKTLNRIITYKAQQPPCEQTFFKPLNINRQGYAQDGDGGLTSNFANATHKIEATVTNNENISDDRDINALDINNDQGFTYKIDEGNNQLGLPLYDFLKVPPALNNGSWEYSTGGYANDRVGDLTDVPSGESAGYYRYNVKSSASITGTAKLNGTNVDVASLITPNGIEYTSSQSYDTSANAGTTNTHYGDWAARFTYNGKFSTDNNYGLTDWRKNWWMIRYNQDRFFEYGITYHGTYDLNNIYSATITAPSGDPKASKTTTTASGTPKDLFTTNGTNQRGLYVGLINKIFYQPVLYGHWDVKTLAGDIN